MNNLRQTVKRYISDHIASEEECEGISDETNLKESGILDSLSTLKLVSFLEETFHVEVRADDLDAGHLSSLERIESYIETRTTMKP